jgi:hypothetical protein
MSKKIAQLTKVIYHLNNKNEDHDYDLAAGPCTPSAICDDSVPVLPCMLTASCSLA